MNRDEARAAFPVLERYAYLNAGSFGPLARATVEAMQERLERDLTLGRGGPSFHDELTEMREALRRRLAALLSVAPENVALTTSTTRGCNIAVAGLGLQPGDEVVTTDQEHFGLLGPLHASGATVRVATLTGRPSAEAFDAIAAEVGARTRLLALSHVSWVTGHVLPVEELRAAFDVPLLIDGAQSVGALPVDVSAVRLLHRLGSEVAVRPRHDGRAVRRRSGAARDRRALVLRPAGVRARGPLHAQGGSGALRLRLDRAALRRRPERRPSTRRPTGATTPRPKPQRAAASCSPKRGSRSSPSPATRRSSRSSRALTPPRPSSRRTTRASSSASSRRRAGSARPAATGRTRRIWSG